METTESSRDPWDGILELSMLDEGEEPLASVLVVDDSETVARLLEWELCMAGYAVEIASDGKTALRAARDRTPDVVLTDVIMPEMDGFEVVRRLRADPTTAETAVIFVTARGMSADRMEGLALGADDYIVKSATPAEVVARVKAVLRRSANGRSTARRFGRLEVDLGAHEVLVDGAPVALTAREFELLTLFVENPRQVLTREQIFERVWGSWGDRSAVSIYVRKLRDKLEVDARRPELLVTVWGVGYRFDPPAAR
jgi:DNA-binding response OmpR family regulator